ncbi:MAG: hypothetical protein MJZ13_05505 [Bacteroidales bacterium]|nr:hypothetical protein [Bacteroidales bacterium]
MSNGNDIKQVDGGRIAKNTLFLYARMMLTMIVTLFTSRVLLDALGEVDYGLNNVIAGLVVVFSFVNGSMASATSRFLTYELGKGTAGNVGRVFATSLKIHGIIALAVLVLGEIVGLVVINNLLDIPEDRLVACNAVYQMVIIMSMTTILQVPFTATIISHERMNVYGYIGIVDALVKCAIAYAIYMSSTDRLILLGALQMMVAIMMLAFYVWYSKRCFGEQVDISGKMDKDIMKQMLGYTSWSIMGSGASMLKNHGVTLLINVFFGPVMNAANAVAYQVNAAVMQFTNNFTMAMNPQIIKSYAAGQMEDMRRLLMRGGKLSFFLLLYLCLPLIIETEQILDLWLKEVPAYAVLLTRLVLVLTMVESFNYTIVCAVQATGNVRDYQIWVGGITLLNFPLTYICYKMGSEPQAALIVSIAVSTFTLFVRLYFLKTQLGVSPREYISKVVVKTWGVALVCAVVPMMVYMNMEANLLRIVAVVATVVVCNSVAIWTMGIDAAERRMMVELGKKLLRSGK